jgi:hypothetical protein
MLDAETFPHAATALIAKRLLGQHSPTEIAEAITVLIDVLDLMGGDPEAEDNGDAEPAGDERDAAWIEWNSMRGSQKRGPNILAGHEDDEEDDPPGQCDEDEINTHDQWLQMGHFGPGCTISDAGGCEHDGREPEDGY